VREGIDVGEKTEISIESELGGRRVPLRLPDHSSTLYFAGGDVGLLAPITVRYRGPEAPALRVRRRLERAGYSVRLVREG